MKTRILPFVWLVLAGLSGAQQAAAAEKGFLCIENQKQGFRLDGGEWDNARFKPDGRFIIEPLDDMDRQGSLGENGKYTWGYREESDTAPYVHCLANADLSSIECDGISHLRMNGKTQRFTATYLHGYIDGDSDDDTPTVALGYCLRR